jgi:prepilin-type N-terminal cleavage/methylation domain-containing protein
MKTNPMIAERRSRGERGFSMIEAVVVIALILIVSAMAIMKMGPALQNARSDTALRQVVDQLRQAREYAIANRRYVQVTFQIVGGVPQIQMIQRNNLTPGAGAVNPVLSTVPLQFPVTFNVFAAMNDTPDGYGNAAAIEFAGVNGGPPAGMLFQSDGELVNAATLLPINGTVFLGVPGDQSSARAVTVLGTTGRVRGWRGNLLNWIQF